MQRPWKYPAEGYPPAEDMARDRLDSEDEDEEIPPDEVSGVGPTVTRREAADAT